MKIFTKRVLCKHGQSNFIILALQASKSNNNNNLDHIEN